MLGKIWERYLVKELLKTAFLFIFCFYFLYVLVDYSIKAKELSQHGLSFSALFQYYGFHFSKRIGVLLPIALAFGTIRTLCQLRAQNELIALLVGGVSSRQILRPFLIIALMGTCLITFNIEYFFPSALSMLDQFEGEKKALSVEEAQQDSLNKLPLTNGSQLLYHTYNAQEQSFSDVFWVQSIDSIIHMEKLYPFQTPPFAYHVDEILRHESGLLLKTASFSGKSFSGLDFDPRILKSSLIKPENQSLSSLWKEWHHPGSIWQSEIQRIQTWFYFKLFFPLINLLAVMIPASYCLRIDTKKSAPIYVATLILLVALFTSLNAAVVLGENNVYSPFTVIFTPICLYFVFFSWQCYKIR